MRFIHGSNGYEESRAEPPQAPPLNTLQAPLLTSPGTETHNRLLIAAAEELCDFETSFYFPQLARDSDRDMDVETTLNGCFNDLIAEPSPNLEPSSKRLSSCDSTACFDCNICLEFAADPVVTLCGHLYCWPCIFRWLNLDTSHGHCPVCKSSLSESSLVPLYGRGLDSKRHEREDSSIPDRPRDHRKCLSPAVASDLHPPLEVRQGSTLYQNHEFHRTDSGYDVGILHSNPGILLMDFVFAVLRRVFRNQEDHRISLYQSETLGSRNQRCRQELMVECWMYDLWLFLLCFAGMCLLCF